MISSLFSSPSLTAKILAYGDSSPSRVRASFTGENPASKA